MYPDDLKAMLGSDYTGSLKKLVWICEAFDKAMKRELEHQIDRHEGRFHKDWRQDIPEPAIGTAEWRRLRKN